MARVEVFDPAEISITHVFNRTVRRCFLMGDDRISGKNFDHRKVWIEKQLKQFAARLGIDLLGFVILSNHFHVMLRSRPDVVASWEDTEVARRWLMLCPHRKNADGCVSYLPLSTDRLECSRIDIGCFRNWRDYGVRKRADKGKRS
ncbi:hypothetical protein CA13_57440 [Planctomycetes bacterium CA13]|uniref:Transposase IS200-like domain-containing protein n=1 Tax=Novipirellula herctigrandis TaxID=2527986 RepID=A0A5C5ZAP7_9BACT|nr:hypothetical protein CA13_57440 [Planctomycetes bacterium CA13]